MNDLPQDSRELLDRASSPLFLLNDRGKRIYSNHAFANLFALGDAGSASGEAADLAFEELFAPPSDSGMVYRSLPQGSGARWFQLRFLPFGSEESPAGWWVSIIETDPPSDEQARDRLARLRIKQKSRWGFDYLPARSEIMRRVLHQVRLAISTDEPVTILGEAGTGKQTLARIIHYQRHGTNANLALLDCDTLTPEIQRQQLMGRMDLPDLSSPLARGLLRAPGQGTICIRSPLSFVGDLQAELVAAVDKDSEVNPLPKEGTAWQILATERTPLELGRADGRLTESFYCMLSRLVIHLPPLRERLPELRDYVQIVLSNVADKLRREEIVLEPKGMELLLAYDWPGNLRELELVLEQAAIRARGGSIAAPDLPRRFHRKGTSGPVSMEQVVKPPPLDQVLEEVERRMLQVALQQNRGNKSKAADYLGISRARLHRRAEQLGLQAPGEKENSAS